MPESAGVRRRSLGPDGPSVSELSVGLEPPTVRAERSPRPLLERIHRLRTVGVTTFDLGHWPGPELADWLRAALGESDRDLVVFVQLPDEESPSTGRLRPGPGTGADPGRLVDELRGRLPLGASVVVFVPVPKRTSPGPRASLDRLRREGRISAWGWQRSGAEGWPDGAPEIGPPILAAPFSLLDRGVLDAMPGAWAETGRLVAQDPFAAGRLDGRRLESALGGAPTGPTALRSLEAAFAPVLALSYLTAGRRRSLPEAALQFLLAFPWVATVRVPAATAVPLAERFAGSGPPPLAAPERARLGLPPGRP